MRKCNFTNYEKTTYFNQNIYFQNFEEKLVDKSKKDIQEEFEKIDLRIRYDKKRIACGWQIKDYRYRKIKTLYGDVSFLRTRYWNKFTKEVKVLVDQEIPIEKHQRIIPNLKIEILNRVGRGNRYCDIVDCLRNSKISEQTISNVVKRFNIAEDTIEDLRGKK